MPVVCLYFQVHQPRRLRHYTFFDIDRVHTYEDAAANRRLLNRAAEKCCLPANRILLDLIRSRAGAFRIAFSISGSLLEQFEKDRPDVLKSYRELADTGCVEFLNETYSHSLAFLFSPGEFRRQILLHQRKIKSLFGRMPTTFHHTGLTYNDHLAHIIEKMGCRAILAEGTKQVLNGLSPDCVYRPAGCQTVKLLFKNNLLSDDIAFHFSNQSRIHELLTAETFARRIHSMNADHAVINLFIHFEVFEDHPLADSVMLDFLPDFSSVILSDSRFRFQTPGEVAASHDPVSVLGVPAALLQADQDPGLTIWLGNAMQKDAVQTLYHLEDSVRRRHNKQSLETWRMLQDSDHFRFMSTKRPAAGDAHRSFSPYFSPYDAYINYMNILDDFSVVLNKTPAYLRKEDHI